MFLQLSTMRKLKTATSELKLLKKLVADYLFHQPPCRDKGWRQVQIKKVEDLGKRKFQARKLLIVFLSSFPHVFCKFLQCSCEEPATEKVYNATKFLQVTSAQCQPRENIDLHLRQATPGQCRIPARGSPRQRGARQPGGQAARRPRLSSSPFLTRQASASRSEVQRSLGALFSFYFSCVRQQFAGSI